MQKEKFEFNLIKLNLFIFVFLGRMLMYFVVKPKYIASMLKIFFFH